MPYIIVFDIKRDRPSFRVKINRLLNKIKAKMIQDSVWEVKNLEDAIEISNLIKANGGKVVAFDKRYSLK